MKELSINFDGKGEVRGFAFHQVKKSDKVYIYEVIDSEFPSDIHYKVFNRVEAKERDTIKGYVKVHYEAMVIYPGAYAFGITAWTYRNYKLAEKKFEEINNEVEIS